MKKPPRFEGKLTHPNGIIEMYVGRRDPAKPFIIELRTDGVLRSPAAKEYNAGTRLYGLVDSDLLWARTWPPLDRACRVTRRPSSSELKRVG